MTSRERVCAAMLRRPVDRVPLSMFFFAVSPTVWRPGDTWNFPWPPNASTAARMRYETECLGLDPVLSFGPTVTRAAPGVTSRTWRTGELLHKAYTTPAGELHAAVRADRRWPHGEDIPFFSDFNIAHFAEPWLQTEQDLACLKLVLAPLPLDEALAQAQADFAACRALSDERGLATMANVGSGLTGMQQLCGAEQLCLLTIDQPDLVDDWLEHEHRLTLTGVAVAAELGCDLWRRNGFYETADFYSPAALRQFLGARLAAETTAARRAGLLSVYTVNTGVMPLLDDLAATGFDALFGIDIAFAGVRLEALRDKLSPTKCLWLGPSSVYHLWHGPEPTRQATRAVLETFGERGLILAPGVSAHSIMPWESTLAMIGEWRAWTERHAATGRG